MVLSFASAQRGKGHLTTRHASMPAKCPSIVNRSLFPSTVHVAPGDNLVSSSFHSSANSHDTQPRSAASRLITYAHSSKAPLLLTRDTTPVTCTHFASIA